MSNTSIGWESSSSSSSTGLSAAPPEQDSATGIILFLSVCILLGCLGKYLVQRFPRVPLPFTVVLLFLGVLMGAVAQYGGSSNNSFQSALFSFSSMSPHLALYIFLPVLIFDSAFNVHFHLFSHQYKAILLMAVPGALICLLFVALFSKYVFDYGWSWAEALMLGSILATTDPVAVVALMRELGSSQSLATLIEGEALLNDGSAFVVYLETQAVLLSSAGTVGDVFKQLFQYALGGPAFGLAVGIVTILIMSQIYADAEIEISITIAVTYLCFWLADAPLGVSAVLAVAVMGLYMAKHRYAVTPSVQPNLTAVWSLLIFAVNIFIFVLSGLIIASRVIGTGNGVRGIDVVWLIILYVLLHVVRFLSIVLFLPLMARTGVTLTWAEVWMISWSGMRGGVSLILALITYLQTGYDQVFRDRLAFQVCGIVLLTLVVNGMSSRYVLEYLQLNKGTEESRLVLNSALQHMRQQTAEAMRAMKADPKFKSVQWVQLKPFMPQQLISEVQQEQGMETQTEQQQETHGKDIGGTDGMDTSWLRDHPIHHIQQSSYHVPGDLTLLNMPTVQYNAAVRQTEPEEEDPAAKPSAPPTPAHASAAAPMPSSLTVYVPPHRHPHPHRQKSSLMAMFEEPQQVEMTRGAPHTGSPSHKEEGHLPPPSGVPEPVSPPPPRAPAAASVSSAAASNIPSSTAPSPSMLQSSLPDPATTAAVASPFKSVTFDALPPPPLLSTKQFRKRLLNHRRLSSRISTFHLSTDVSQHKINLHRELSARFLTAMQADYHRQFSAGLITTRSLRVLVAACGAAIDEGSLGTHWTFLSTQLRVPAWLSWIYASTLNDDTHYPTLLSPIRAVIHRLMFDHLKVSIELTTAYLAAKQRMEYVLQAFPEFDEIDSEVVEDIRKQAGYYQKKALAAWLDVCEGYHEAHSAVVTRHAAVLLLHFQQTEIKTLHGTGMLEQREYDSIVSLIHRKLLRLERKGIALPMSCSMDLFLQLPFIKILPTAQQTRLRVKLQEKEARRWYQTHTTVWSKDEPCPGALVIVRGTVRLLYEYEDEEGTTLKHAASTPAVNPLDVHHDHDDIRWHRLLLSSGVLPSSRVSQQQLLHAERERQLGLRFYDSQGTGNVIGAYESIHHCNTIASASTATMVEAFFLDQECLSILLHEEEVLHSLVRAAADSLLKAKWRQWNMKERGMKEYHLSPLLQRAEIHLTEHSHHIDLQNHETLLLLHGKGTGKGIKIITKRKRKRSIAFTVGPKLARTASTGGVDNNSHKTESDKKEKEKDKEKEKESGMRMQDVHLTEHDEPAGTPAPPVFTPPPPPPPPPPPSPPVYSAPSLLSLRRGHVLMEAGCVYLKWNRRDEEISALHPPPPRADIKEYAATLGLTMQIGHTTHTDKDRDKEKEQEKEKEKEKEVATSTTTSSPSPAEQKGMDSGGRQQHSPTLPLGEQLIVPTSTTSSLSRYGLSPPPNQMPTLQRYGSYMGVRTAAISMVERQTNTRSAAAKPAAATGAATVYQSSSHPTSMPPSVPLPFIRQSSQGGDTQALHARMEYTDEESEEEVEISEVGDLKTNEPERENKDLIDQVLIDAENEYQNSFTV